MQARGRLGALCSTEAASSALTVEKDSAGAFAGARYVARYWIKTLELSMTMKLRRECGRAGVMLRGTEWIRKGWQAVDDDDGDAPPVFVAVARRLRISAQIIFFQRKEGVRSRKGARACG